MSRIFISYKRVDKNKVFPIVKEIKQKTGVDCWIDLDGIESGDQFQNVIIEAIENADVVVFMLSKNFIAPYKDAKTGKVDPQKQTYTEREVMYAFRHNKRLVPLSIDGTSVSDCKWLDFNCSGLDCIDWRNLSQRGKLLHNISLWSTEGKEVDGDDKDGRGQKAHLGSRLRKMLMHYWAYLSAIVFLVVFISLMLGAYFSPTKLFLRVDGIPEDSAATIPNRISKIKNLSKDKITLIMEDVTSMGDLSPIVTKIGGFNDSGYSICLGGEVLKYVRSLMCKKDAVVRVVITRDANNWIANISMRDLEGKQYKKTVESGDVSGCLDKIAAYTTLLYSPVASVLFDYEPLEESDEYSWKSPWKGNLYNNDERVQILEESIKRKWPESKFCNLILGSHYEYLAHMGVKYIVLACQYYGRFLPCLSFYPQSVTAINKKISFLKAIQVKPSSSLSLPEILVEKGFIPKLTECKQLVIVADERNFVYRNKNKKLATLSTFECVNGLWKMKFKPFTVNLSVHGIINPDLKREGDLCIPSGFYALPLALGYKKDISTRMDFVTVTRNHVWICDPNDEKYNQMVVDQTGKYKRVPNEELMRPDHLYKYVIVIDYNSSPIIKGKGSAIFLHVERKAYSVSAGCITMPENQIIKLLKWLDPAMKPHIFISKESVD